MSILQKFVTAGALFGVFIFGFFYYKGYFSKKQSFYLCLKRRKDRPKYKLRKISQIDASGIEGVFEEGSSNFLLFLSFHNEDIVRVLINDYNNPKYTVQDVILKNDKSSNIKLSFEDNKKEKNVFCYYKNLRVKISYGDHLNVKIYKNNELLVFFNPRHKFLVDSTGFSADFLFSEARKAYGLAQHAENVVLRETDKQPYQLYNSDICGIGLENNWKGVYGSVPVLYAQGVNKTSGILWLNASETYIDINYEVDGIYSTFYSEGGALEFFVLTGPTLKDCVKQNATLTGGFCGRVNIVWDKIFEQIQKFSRLSVLKSTI